MSAAGDLIRARREAHRITQRQLAIRAGTSQSAIAQIESGKRSPTVETLERLLLVLGEELDLEGAVRPSRWRDHDPVHFAAFQRLTPDERLEQGLAFSEDVRDLLGAAKG